MEVPPESLQKDMIKFLNDEELSDVTFSVGSSLVKANRSLLAARSDHFRALFITSGMKESFGDKVVVPDVTEESFRFMLEYIYTDQLPEQCTTWERSIDLLIIADRFKLTRLRVLCEDSIRRSLNVDNVISVLITCHKNNVEALKALCLEFFINNEELLKLKNCSSMETLMHEPALVFQILAAKPSLQNVSSALNRSMVCYALCSH